MAGLHVFNQNIGGDWGCTCNCLGLRYHCPWYRRLHLGSESCPEYGAQMSPVDNVVILRSVLRAHAWRARVHIGVYAGREMLLVQRRRSTYCTCDCMGRCGRRFATFPDNPLVQPSS